MAGPMRRVWDWIISCLCLWLRPWCFRVNTRDRDLDDD